MIAYRQYSSYSPAGDIWSISFNVYSDIFSSLLIDKNYLLKDLDIVFKKW